MLFKVWVYYKKSDFKKLLGVYFCYVKMPQCGCLEHGLEYILFYVQKHIRQFAACSRSPLVRDWLLGVPAFVKLTYSFVKSNSNHMHPWGEGKIYMETTHFPFLDKSMSCLRAGEENHNIYSGSQ